MAPPPGLCSSSSSRSLLTPPASPLFFLLSVRTRRITSPPCAPRITPLLPLPVKSTTSASYNGWADLAAAPDGDLFALPLQFPTTTHGRGHGLILLLPATALALSLSLSIARLPPLPLLAAAFTAGFAARHLSSPQSQSPTRLAAALADLDAQVRSLRDQLTASTHSESLLIEAVDRLRDAVLDATRLAAQPNTTTLPPVLGPLGDVAKEVAHCFGAWARDTVRDLSSPPKKPRDSKLSAPVTAREATVHAAHTNSDVAVTVKGNKPAAAQAQQQDVNKLVDSPIHVTSTEHRPFDSAVTGNSSERPLDMLQFNEDATGPDDAEMGVQGNLGDARLERLVFKHRHGHNRVQNDPFQAGSTRFSAESMESSLLERTLEIRDRLYRLKIERRDTESQVSEAQDGPDDSFVSNVAGLDPIYDESAATDSDGHEFSYNMKEAAEMLRKARECMMARADEEAADALLYKSARLLSTAVALRPTSLVAVGQLGNTYLLHGELKLKISRELRPLLANTGAFLNGRERVPQSRKVDRRILSKENISSVLVDVCEECESLLVEAGRSYRMALSIDSGDVKALYNWGLALIFRAQLLADIGPEAAVDADRVYLAAIDKFDAMLSESNTYAPEALYRWGTALQQRSHLRPRNNKEKIRLLEQAKSLFEDVLYVEADNKMVREALSSCISELNYHGRWL